MDGVVSFEVFCSGVFEVSFLLECDIVWTANRIPAWSVLRALQLLKKRSLRCLETWGSEYLLMQLQDPQERNDFLVYAKSHFASRDVFLLKAPCLRMLCLSMWHLVASCDVCSVTTTQVSQLKRIQQPYRPLTDLDKNVTASCDAHMSARNDFSSTANFSLTPSPPPSPTAIAQTG
jgi:hypothetical protein